MTDVLKTIFSISDGYERAAEIELIEASLDALGDNKKANTALHLLCNRITTTSHLMTALKVY